MKGNSARFCWPKVEVRMGNVLCLCKLTVYCFLTTTRKGEHFHKSLFWINIFKSVML